VNRETKRMLQRQGELGPDGEPVARRQQPQRPTGPPKERTGPAQFAREIRGELRKVAWPTRDEVVRSSLVVLVTLAVVMAFIAGIDTVFAKAVLFLFDA